jgi:hypothetical protein
MSTEISPHWVLGARPNMEILNEHKGKEAIVREKRKIGEQAERQYEEEKGGGCRFNRRRAKSCQWWCFGDNIRGPRPLKGAIDTEII